MDINAIQQEIDNTNYWDCRVESVECNYFADEVKMSYKTSDGVFCCIFNGCYRTNFDHVKTYNKLMPVKNMSKTQIPYFLIDISIDKIIEDNLEFLTCAINMFPLNISIWCQNIQIIKTQGD